MSALNSGFRSDIELLRGIAVIVVVLYHLDIALFRSGFIGVDIFFVLSGYLIASIYSLEPNPIRFYERRIRRVLPAMLVTAIAFLLIAPFIFLPFELQKLVDPIVGVLLFIPNVIFWRDNDYFSNLDFSPIIHYWSLGVELQFYLLFPVIFYFLRKWKITLAIFIFASIIANILATKVSQKLAFFMLPFRTWEFLAGYLCHLLLQNKISYEWLTLKLRTAISLISIFALLFLTTTNIPRENFPGLYAIAPVIFSTFIIYFEIPYQALFKFSITKVVQWIGKISFSIYLVHFPIIFIFKYSPFSEFHALTNMERVFAVLLSLIFGFISYNFIERPFRNPIKTSKRKFLIFTISLYCVIVMILLFYSENTFFLDRIDKNSRPPIAAMLDRGGWRCTKLQKLRELSADSCALYRSSTPSKIIYLVGDSHIDVLKEAFVSSAKAHEATIRINKNRCALGKSECSADAIINNIKKYGITDVVLHGYDYKIFDYDDLTNFIKFAQSHKIRVHIIGPIPTYNVSVPSSLYKESRGLRSELIRQNINYFEQQIPQEYIKFLNSVHHYSMINIYHPEIYFCTPNCILADEKVAYYFDSNHLTLTGALIL